MATAAKFYALYIFIKTFSGWGECSASNFLSFSACEKIYLLGGLIIFCIIAGALGWIGNEEEKKNKLDKK